MKSIILFLALVFCGISSCKNKSAVVNSPEPNYIPYYLKVYEADSLHNVGEYKRSFEILDSLFANFKPLNQESYGEYLMYLRNKVLLSDFEKIDRVVQKAIQDFGYKPEYTLSDSLFSIAVKKAGFSARDLDGFYKSYSNKLNLEYRSALEKMIENDQRVRLAVPKNNDDFNKVDSENAEAIKALISRYGYPGIKKIGTYSYNERSCRVSTLFLHATTKAREAYILDLMMEAVKKGECEPSDFAVVYDKYLMSKGTFGDRVLYGELRNPSKSIDEHLVDPRKIDSIRKSIGLENINYRMWKLGKYAEIESKVR